MSSAICFNLEESKILLSGNGLTLYHTIPTYYDCYKKPFKNTVEKGENAGDQHFLLFPQCFLPMSKRISVFKSHLFCRLPLLSIWTSLKICRLAWIWAEEFLTHSHTMTPFEAPGKQAF